MMQLGLSLGYWGAQPPTELVPLVLEAERLGYDAVWTAESWGSDAFSPLVFLAAHTERIRLGTGIVQMSARTPTATAMHAVTLDHLSNGRLILGLGVSGPQVVEGTGNPRTGRWPERVSTSRSSAGHFSATTTSPSTGTSTNSHTQGTDPPAWASPSRS